MPKKIKFESYVYQFLVSARDVGFSLPPTQRLEWQNFLNDLEFQYCEGYAVVSWTSPQAGSLRTQLRDPSINLYTRGDNERAVEKQENCAASARGEADFAKAANARIFKDLVNQVRAEAGFTNNTTNYND